ncbi:Methionyl-tRNA synthetase [Ceraceosorus bombacis]|uniref:Probable methionine--tRNA ligase, mitochondrial n=1 Tax=Ceraceosorus bombacis TaxID=401625 RepID=A0A0P1BT20_9BASI|nr:Methionyl-tRNA synthetase [Ceraceosorus bombacis]
MHKPNYITTPIFYVNASPHIGHLHSMILADVCARWAAYKRGDVHAGGLEVLDPADQSGTGGAVAGENRAEGTKSNVLLATGTDEHGQKVQRAASQGGEHPKQMCDRVSETFRSLASAAGLMQHTFIRTTDEKHVKAVQHLWRRLDAAGHIYKGSHQGWYAISDEAFYTDSQIRRVRSGSGEEYHESIETGQRVEWHLELNYKFRLSTFKEPLIRWIEENPQCILPSARRDQVLKELKEVDLEDLSVSRPRNRLEWGIQVPDDPEHTIYVWIDALTNYLTVAGYPWEDGSVPTSSAWPADAHILGKDIIRFHAIYWPAMLLAASLPLPEKIVTHGHWTSSNKKMSKSLGNVQDPFESLKLFGQDEIRWFLLRIGGRLDGDSDGSDGAKEGVRVDDSAEELLAKIAALPDIVEQAMQQYETARVLTAISDVMGEANAFIANSAPWSKTLMPAERRMMLYALHETIRVVSALLKPFMPGKMSQLQRMFAFEEATLSWEALRRPAERIEIVFRRPALDAKGKAVKGGEREDVLFATHQTSADQAGTAATEKSAKEAAKSTKGQKKKTRNDSKKHA